MSRRNPVQFSTAAILALLALFLISAAQPQCGGSKTDVTGPSNVIGLHPSDDDDRPCPDFTPPPSHTKLMKEDGCEALHAPGHDEPFASGCAGCHGPDLKGDFGPSCFTCHGREWDDDEEHLCPDFTPPPSHTKLMKEDGCEALHAPGHDEPFASGCTGCHGADLKGDFGPSCFTCHGVEWDDDKDDDLVEQIGG